MDKKEIIRYWLDSSEGDFATMQKFFEIKEYPWSLFIGHLALEKMLKALYIQNSGSDVPRIHDLKRLAELSGLNFTKEISRNLDTISSFNLNARYPDYKMKFHKLCTQEYASEQIKIIKEIRTWLKSLIEIN